MRVWRCRCTQPVFFRNSWCVACHTPLGYDPVRARVLPLQPCEAAEPLWTVAGPDAPRRCYWRCSRFEGAGASGCNWLVAVDDAIEGRSPECRCCRLLRTVADLGNPQHQAWFAAIEQARRQLVARLLLLGLPVNARSGEAAQQDLAFDLLRAAPGGPPILTGHAAGVITLDIEEADDAAREARRRALREPARTVLGHLRHESGHYYWTRLVQPRDELVEYRSLFGDERDDYAGALERHYAQGPASDWALRCVSAYASAHPWEDWAETWAHYLHFIDTLETARALGLSGRTVGLDFEPFDPAALGDHSEGTLAFAEQLRDWMELAAALNELCRSMGVADFYPFVLSAPAARKLHFVHRLVAAHGNRASPP